MSAADHLREALEEGCTRDDHDHIGAYRDEILAHFELLASETISNSTTWDAGSALAAIVQVLCRQIRDSKL